MIKSARSLFSTMLLIGLLPLAAQAGYVNYQAQGTDVQPGTTFDAGGILVTGSAGLDVQSYGGLGVLGGFVIGNGAQLIDGNESARFTFDSGPATSVLLSTVFRSSPSANYIGSFQGFGSTGQSLGFYYFYATTSPTVPVDLSAAFNNAPLSSFIFNGGGNGGAAGISVGSISFNSAVPEPASIWLCGLSSTAGIVFAWRRRSRSAP